MTGFQAITDGETATANGSFTLTLDSRDLPLTRTRIVGAALKAVTTADEVTLSAFDQQLEEDFGGSPVTHQAKAKGTLTSKRLGGTVAYATELGKDIIGLDDDDPYTGVIGIQGKGNSRIRLVLVDTGIVVLEIDADGDGTPESFIDTTWVELEGSA